MKAESKKLLADLQNPSADTRYAAWVSAAVADPEVVPELGSLLVAEQPGVRKAADEALKKIVHSVGREAGGRRRGDVVKELLALAAPGKSKWARTVALRHLSTIGGDTVVPPVAKILREPELQEEAAFCLERIPGAASDGALMAAFSDVKDDFKPRILAALGHRRVAAAAPLCAKAMASPDANIAVAAMKALARIGRNPGMEMVPPDVESLAGFQQVEFADSMLRYADGMVESGRTAEAIGLYRLALDRPEEHLQCAAIIGLGKLRSAQAAELIGPKRKSGQRNVRITAEKVWAAMAPARPQA